MFRFVEYNQKEKDIVMSVELGRYNYLEIVKEVSFGLYLDGGDDGEILLPKRYVPEKWEIGDFIKVFIYLDMDERLVATTQQPLIQVGEFALLKTAWVNQHGAFMDWGLMKDLFVPFREQKSAMEVGKKYMVYAYIDSDSYRITATAKIEKYMSKDKPNYEKGVEVDVVVWQKSELGYRVIVDNEYYGMIYDNEIFENISIGEKRKGYVKNVREDNKIDITLSKSQRESSADFETVIMDFLKSNGGRISLGDKSSAEDIYSTFGVSKKVFKRTLGALYKARKIRLGDYFVELVEG